MNDKAEQIWLNERKLVDRNPQWERVAEVDAGRGIPLVLFPLQLEDRYLALNWAEDLLLLGAMDHYLLAMQPMENGTLLLATRSPEVLKAALEVGRLAGKTASREMLSRWAADPAMIRWLALDPATWKVDVNPSYQWPLPDAAENFGQLSRFQFIIDPNGKVRGNPKGTWQTVLTEMDSDAKRGKKSTTGEGALERPEKKGVERATPDPVGPPIPD